MGNVLSTWRARAGDVCLDIERGGDWVLKRRNGNGNALEAAGKQSIFLFNSYGYLEALQSPTSMK